MTKFRFPGRTTKNSTNRQRVHGYKHGTHEAAVSATKISLAYQNWQHLCGNSPDEDFYGFTQLEAQQSALLANNTAINNARESEELLKTSPHLDQGNWSPIRVNKSPNSKYLVPKKTEKYKKSKSEKCLSPNKASSIILKPSTLKFESSNSGYTLGSSWQSSSSTLKPTSLPDAKSCIICEQMTSHPDVQCDWCRSFMENMTSKNTQKLICLRGRGICKVTQTDIKTRCHACWLACCLTKLPVAHKTLARLKKCLPTSLQFQIGTGIPVKKDPLRGWSDNITNQSKMAARLLMKAAKAVSNKNKVTELSSTSSTKKKELKSDKRQKSHLKGPRIKHVCRRACVVLGQPLATFPASPDPKHAENKKDGGTSKSDKKSSKLSLEVVAPVILTPDLMGLPALPPNKSDPPPGWICLDYEPPEGTTVPVISQSGGVSDLPLALCLMCGSAGKDELLFCAICCEPYHIFCLELTPQLNKMWICERCELCCDCNEPTLHHDDVIRCHRCAAPYHKHCLSIKPSQRPWECPACNVCRSCNSSSNSMRHVGNTAFCPPCYKLRLKGNFCPLCQQCYQDDDYDTKMVECAECLSWVHARCEMISDEKYQILSHLPDSVEFHCQNCTTQTPALWQIAVENEIRNGVISIIQNLAKYTSIKVTPHKVDRTSENVGINLKNVPEIGTNQPERGKNLPDFGTNLPVKGKHLPEENTKLENMMYSTEKIQHTEKLQDTYAVGRNIQSNSGKSQLISENIHGTSTKNIQSTDRSQFESENTQQFTEVKLLSSNKTEMSTSKSQEISTKNTQKSSEKTQISTSNSQISSKDTQKSSEKTQKQYCQEKELRIILEKTDVPSLMNKKTVQKPGCSYTIERKSTRSIENMKVPIENKSELLLKKHPKIEAAKIKLDFGETRVTEQKQKATQTLKLKQICDAYNIKECSVHLRKCSLTTNNDCKKKSSENGGNSTSSVTTTNNEKSSNSEIVDDTKNKNNTTKSSNKIIFGTQNSSLGSDINTNIGTQNTNFGTQTTKLGLDCTKLGSQNTKFETQNTNFGAQNTKLRLDSTNFGTQNTKSSGTQNIRFETQNTNFGTQTTKLGLDSTKIDTQNTTIGQHQINKTGPENSEIVHHKFENSKIELFKTIKNSTDKFKIVSTTKCDSAKNRSESARNTEKQIVTRNKSSKTSTRNRSQIESTSVENNVIIGNDINKDFNNENKIIIGNAITSSNNEMNTETTVKNDNEMANNEKVNISEKLKTPDKNANYGTIKLEPFKTPPSSKINKLFEFSPAKMSNQQLSITLKKANLGYYQSFIAFDLEFQNEILKNKSELKGHYLKLVSETFPWYKQDQNKIQEQDILPKIELDTRAKIYTSRLDSEKSFSQLYLPAFGDDRICALCKISGDRDGSERMLHTCLPPPSDWVHANCALWSSEVWEDRDGFLHSVATGAISRSNRTKCALCGNKGASVGCCHSGSCPNSYHWPCAQSLLTPQDGETRIGVDLTDLSLFCPDHSEQHVTEQEEGEPEFNFTLSRKLRIEPSKNKKRKEIGDQQGPYHQRVDGLEKSFKGTEILEQMFTVPSKDFSKPSTLRWYADPDKVQVAIGSLRVERIGTISSSLCHDEARDLIIPEGYVSTRLFWSTKEPWRIVEYHMVTELELEDSSDEGIGRDINLTVEHGSHGAPQEVMEKNLRVLRHIQQQEIDVLTRDSEMKENADDLLLPPDLKETIFQDLNSELLDGISMQDIFTKLLSEDSIKEEVLSDSEEVTYNPLKDALDKSYYPIKDVLDNILDQVCEIERNRKRKSEFEFPPVQKKQCFGLKSIPQLDGTDDLEQKCGKSSNLKTTEFELYENRNLNTKIVDLSTDLNEPMVKIYYSKPTTIETRLKVYITPVNSTVDEISELSKNETRFSNLRQNKIFKISEFPTKTENRLELSSTPSVNLSLLKRLNSSQDFSKISGFTTRNRLELISTNNLSLPRTSKLLKISEFLSKSETCSPMQRLELNLSPPSTKKLKIPQADGADDSSSDSDSTTITKSNGEMKVEVETSLTRKIKERSLASSEPCEEGPVKCESCKRTYRTRTSYDKHLSSCTEVSSDSSDESVESPSATTSRLTTTTSKYGTVVLKTKLVLMQSPPTEKQQKRKNNKLVKKTVKLAAKPDVNVPEQCKNQPQFSNYQELLNQNSPIFITPQPNNTVYYINVTPTKQNYLVVPHESPNMIYQEPIIIQQQPYLLNTTPNEIGGIFLNPSSLLQQNNTQNVIIQQPFQTLNLQNQQINLSNLQPQHLNLQSQQLNLQNQPCQQINLQNQQEQQLNLQSQQLNLQNQQPIQFQTTANTLSGQQINLQTGQLTTPHQQAFQQFLNSQQYTTNILNTNQQYIQQSNSSFEQQLLQSTNHQELSSTQQRFINETNQISCQQSTENQQQSESRSFTPRNQQIILNSSPTRQIVVNSPVGGSCQNRPESQFNTSQNLLNTPDVQQIVLNSPRSSENQFNTSQTPQNHLNTSEVQQIVLDSPRSSQNHSESHLNTSEVQQIVLNSPRSCQNRPESQFNTSQTLLNTPEVQQIVVNSLRSSESQSQNQGTMFNQQISLSNHQQQHQYLNIPSDLKEFLVRKPNEDRNSSPIHQQLVRNAASQRIIRSNIHTPTTHHVTYTQPIIQQHMSTSKSNLYNQQNYLLGQQNIMQTQQFQQQPIQIQQTLNQQTNMLNQPNINEHNSMQIHPNALQIQPGNSSLQIQPGNSLQIQPTNMQIQNNSSLQIQPSSTLQSLQIQPTSMQTQQNSTLQSLQIQPNNSSLQIQPNSTLQIQQNSLQIQPSNSLQIQPNSSMQSFQIQPSNSLQIQPNNSSLQIQQNSLQIQQSNTMQIQSNSLQIQPSNSTMHQIHQNVLQQQQSNNLRQILPNMLPQQYNNEQFKPINFNYVQRSSQQVQKIMKQKHPGLIHIGSYRKPTNVAKTTTIKPPVATATRLYVQQSSNATSTITKPATESKVVKITASASVGTQTTLRCATPSSIKKEPLDVEEKTGLLFKIQSSDGYSTTASNVSQAWQNIFEAVQTARKAYNLAPLPYNPFSLSGQHMSGLSQDPMKYLIEQLPGANKCTEYIPKFHLNSSQKDRTKPKLKEPKLNQSGCARTEAFKTRNPYDMFGWLASAHRKPPTISLSQVEPISRRASTSLPMAMRFRHLKSKVKVKVGVFRSHIHGRGLFCLRELEAAEMVIEYAGEVIRSGLTDKREKIYESRGIGCYMFRVDDNIVVDATMKGNAARFINHSCEPNCYSRVVDVLGKKHILIFALRRIQPGEELTYDYKFPFEDDKIPCTCNSRKCRKYLN